MCNVLTLREFLFYLCFVFDWLLFRRLLFSRFRFQHRVQLPASVSPIRLRWISSAPLQPLNHVFCRRQIISSCPCHRKMPPCPALQLSHSAPHVGTNVAHAWNLILCNNLALILPRDAVTGTVETAAHKRFFAVCSFSIRKGHFAEITDA